MDDMLILGTNASDIHKAMDMIIQKAKEMGLEIKDSWSVFTTVSKMTDTLSTSWECAYTGNTLRSGGAYSYVFAGRTKMRLHL